MYYHPLAFWQVTILDILPRNGTPDNQAVLTGSHGCIWTEAKMTQVGAGASERGRRRGRQGAEGVGVGGGLEAMARLQPSSILLLPS